MLARTPTTTIDPSAEVERIALSLVPPEKTNRLKLAEGDVARLRGQRDDLQKQAMELATEARASNTVRDPKLAQAQQLLAAVETELAKARRYQQECREKFAERVREHVGAGVADFEQVFDRRLDELEQLLEPPLGLDLYFRANGLEPAGVVERAPQLAALVRALRQTMRGGN